VPAIVGAGAGVAERLTPPLSDLVLNDAGDASALVAQLLRWRANVDHYRHAAREMSGTLRAQTWQTMAEQFVAAVEEPMPAACAAGYRTTPRRPAVGCGIR
jgi:hypothetical protein